MSNAVNPGEGKKEAEKRSRISQVDVPAYGLTEALRVSQAINDNYAGKPAKPLDVAAAMTMSPTSSTFKMITGASIAYGLTEGGYNASNISLTSLAKRIVAPLEEDDDKIALREALIRPRIVGDFLRNYDGKQLPKGEIAKNVISSMNCPRERADDVLNLIVSEAEKLGLITSIKGKQYVNLRGTSERSVDISGDEVTIETSGDFNDTLDLTTAPNKDKYLIIQKGIVVRKVFITHGKNKAFIEPIKRLLAFGEMEAVVSVESQSVSQPVPEKVMSDMRSCDAAIIHVAAEQNLIDKDANEHVIINQNVLIEIGAAMALFGRRFILLVREGVKLPSNLQGLYEVRYNSDQLDGDATIRLMEAIKALKATPSPS